MVVFCAIPGYPPPIFPGRHGTSAGSIVSWPSQRVTSPAFRGTKWKHEGPSQDWGFGQISRKDLVRGLTDNSVPECISPGSLECLLNLARLTRPCLQGTFAMASALQLIFNHFLNLRSLKYPISNQNYLGQSSYLSINASLDRRNASTYRVYPEQHR